MPFFSNCPSEYIQSILIDFDHYLADPNKKEEYKNGVLIKLKNQLKHDVDQINYIYNIHDITLNNVRFDEDLQSVHYTGDAKHNHDVGTVQIHPAINLSSIFFYREIQVLHDPNRQDNNNINVSLGLSKSNFPSHRRVGTTSFSLSYHSTNGYLYFSSIPFMLPNNINDADQDDDENEDNIMLHGKEFGPSLVNNDYLGLGYDFYGLFYTING